MEHHHDPNVETKTYVRDVEEEDAGEESDDEESIEIQRVFFIPDDFHERVKHHGGRLIVEEKFVDEYFDRDDYFFLLNDVRISSRNGQWELRYGEPDSLDVPDAGTNLSRRILYHSRHSTEEILKLLRSKNLLEGAVESADLDLVMNSVPFRSFGKFTVTKKVFAIPSHGDTHPAKICAEDSEFGLKLADIQVSVDDNDSIPSALKTVDELAAKLGFIPLSSSGNHVVNGSG